MQFNHFVSVTYAFLKKMNSVSSNMLLKGVDSENPPLYGFGKYVVENDEEKRIAAKISAKYAGTSSVNRIDLHNYYTYGVVTKEIEREMQKMQAIEKALKIYREFTKENGITPNGSLY
jgi:hypothetical protein